MKRWWRVWVFEEGDGDLNEYLYYYDTWPEVLAKLQTFDGLALEYIISQVNK